MKIRGKIFLSVMTTALIFFATVVLYLGWNFRKNSINEAYKLADSFAEQSALRTKNILGDDISAIRTLSDVFSIQITNDKETTKKSYIDLQRQLLKSNEKFLSVWASWEYFVINENWVRNHGRQTVLVLKEKEVMKIQIDTTNLEGDSINSLYYKVKVSPEKEFVVNPYYYKYVSNEIKDSILETSLVSKIYDNGKFVGLLGIDLALPQLQNITNTELPFDESSIFLIANNSTFITHPNPEMLGEPISKVFDDKYSNIDIVNNIKQGKTFSLDNINDEGEVTGYTSFAPIVIGNSKEPWSVGITVPIEIITKSAVDNFGNTLIVGILGFLFLTVVIFFISANITKPLENSIQVLKQLEKGNINIKYSTIDNRSDELGIMSESINKLIISLNNTADFAIKIGKGELQTKYNAISEQDILGNALLEMRNDLRTASEDRKERLIESQKISWAQRGISEFGEILQKNVSNPEVLADALIKKLIKYIDASQGGLFIINSETNIIEMKSAYAYDKKKKLQTTFEIGEGLIGRCAKEQKTIHLDNIPDGYTFISSGLGEDKPKTLLLIPLLYETKITGVIELASFKPIEQYKIKFIENLGQRIATTFNNLRMSVETNVLIKQFHEQTDKLEKKEKSFNKVSSELRNSEIDNEILKAEIRSKDLAFDSVASIITYDLQGKIIELNKKAERIIGKKCLNKTQSEVFPVVNENVKWYSLFWTDLRQGKQRKKDTYITINSQDVWLHETYTPMFNKDGKPISIMCVGIDITKQKKLEKEFINK